MHSQKLSSPLTIPRLICINCYFYSTKFQCIVNETYSNVIGPHLINLNDSGLHYADATPSDWESAFVVTNSIETQQYKLIVVYIAHIMFLEGTITSNPPSLTGYIIVDWRFIAGLFVQAPSNLTTSSGGVDECAANEGGVGECAANEGGVDEFAANEGGVGECAANEGGVDEFAVDGGCGCGVGGVGRCEGRDSTTWGTTRGESTPCGVPSKPTTSSPPWTNS